MKLCVEEYEPGLLDVERCTHLDGRFVKVSGLDALDGSALVDIKPYSASIDPFPEARIGWLEGKGG
jgi:formylmethanofuran dehydrogenase subunit E